MVFDSDEELGPLHAAARDGNLAGVREALRRFGAGTRDLWGQTALHWVSSVEVAKTLVAAGGSPSDVDPTGDTPLHWAAEHGNTAVVEFLITQEVNINAANRRGDTPLHAAAASRNFETIRVLLDANADPKAVNGVGETAMHVAARTGEVNVVKSLVKAGGKVKVAASNGSTPLHEACRVHTSLQLIKYLIQRNADVNATTLSGRAVLQDAVKRKAHPIIEELMDKGAEVACLVRDAALRGHGWTALHLAAEAGSLKLCQAIVKKGATFYDAEAQTAGGLRPVDVARESAYSNDKVVKYLEEQVKLKKLAHGGESRGRDSPLRGGAGSGGARQPRASAAPTPDPGRSRRGSLANSTTVRGPPSAQMGPGRGAGEAGADGQGGAERGGVEAGEPPRQRRLLPRRLPRLLQSLQPQPVPRPPLPPPLSHSTPPPNPPRSRALRPPATPLLWPRSHSRRPQRG